MKMETSKENPNGHDSNNSAFYYFSILVTFWLTSSDPPATNNDQQRARDDSLLWRPDRIRQNAWTNKMTDGDLIG
jgi:hypothetical protein